ncbi:MAG: phosphatase PAP2 family protein [Candidatus Pacearchaeota archaeon]
MKFIKKNREMIIFIIIVAFFIISLILDHQFLSLIESLRCPALNIFFEKIILFENNIFIYYTSILITTIFILILTKRKKQIPSYIISLAVLGILTLTLKFLVARPRPNNSTVHSFPSGHTVAVFASVSFFNKLKTLQIFWFILSCMFALTRIWFSMHYLSDIVAGAAIGYYVPTIIQKMIEKHYKIKCKQAK